MPEVPGASLGRRLSDARSWSGGVGLALDGADFMRFGLIGALCSFFCIPIVGLSALSAFANKRYKP